MRSIVEALVRAVVVAGGLLVGSGAHADAVQVLDSVDAYGPRGTGASTVLEMAFRDPLPRNSAYDELNVAAGTLLSCQRSVGQALYCIDGNYVRLFPDTRAVPPRPGTAPLPDIELVNCRDPVLGFDTRRPNACTSLTVDLNGALWLAGRKGSAHSLVKIVEESSLVGGCAATGSIATLWVRLNPAVAEQDDPDPVQPVPTLCAREWAPGRPILVDTNIVDGDLVDGFAGVAGVLGLEERKTVMFFADAYQGNTSTPRLPVAFASGKADWNLAGGEQLLSVSLLQFGDPAVSHVLVTTTSGRVLAKKAGSDGRGVGQAFRVFDLGLGACSGTGEQMYAVRVSSQSERVYVSDKFCRSVRALRWETDPGKYPSSPRYCAATNAFCLVPATEGDTGSQTPVVLSTEPTSPTGLSVAPGIGIDLGDCAAGSACPIVADGTDDNTFNGAELSNVYIDDNGKSKMVVFQVRGIPDCRFWSDAPGCDQGGVVVPGPDGEYLNIYPLLPLEVTLQIEPVELLIAPRYRGQTRPGAGSPEQRTIDLLFGIPESGVRFRGAFDGSFDVSDLTDKPAPLGCGGTPYAIGGTDLGWEVVTSVSENYVTVGGPGDPSLGPAPAFVVPQYVPASHADMLVTVGCSNPTQVSGGRWSAYSYNLEVDDSRSGDAVYAVLLRSLVEDIAKAQLNTACADVDDGAGNEAAPLSPTTCASLLSRWQSAYDKLDRCIRGSTYPRQSEAVNNCQSFATQFGHYESLLGSAVRNGPDVANRIGELIARARVVRYVYENHYLPSIPPNGFCGISPVPCP